MKERPITRNVKAIVLRLVLVSIFIKDYESVSDSPLGLEIKSYRLVSESQTGSTAYQFTLGW